MTMETGLGDHATAGYNRRMSIEDLLSEVTRLYRTNGLTGIQSFDGSGMSGTGSRTGSPDRLLFAFAHPDGGREVLM